jgi:DNA-binding NtrC family response regulator
LSGLSPSKYSNFRKINLNTSEATGMISPHVLVVGNEPTTLHSLGAMLASASYCAEESTLSPEALVRVGRDPAPDLVLLELGSGNGKGLPMLRKLRAMRPDLAIVVLSAPGNSREVVEAIRLGAQDYLNVPLQETELQRILRRYLNATVGAMGPRRSGETIDESSGIPQDDPEQVHNLKLLVRNRKFETEIEEITKALAETNWNRTAAARLLNISYRGLLYKIQQHGIARDSASESATSRTVEISTRT